MRASSGSASAADGSCWCASASHSAGRELPLGGDGRAERCRGEAEHLELDLVERQAALVGDGVQLAEAILGVADEDDQAEVVQQAGDERLLARDALRAAEDARAHGGAQRVVEDARADLGEVVLIGGEEARDRGGDREVLDRGEAEQHDGVRQRLDAARIAVVGGVGELQDHGGQRLIAGHDAGQARDGSVRVVALGDDLGQHVGHGQREIPDLVDELFQRGVAHGVRSPRSMLSSTSAHAFGNSRATVGTRVCPATKVPVRIP